MSVRQGARRSRSTPRRGCRPQIRTTRARQNERKSAGCGRSCRLRLCETAGSPPFSVCGRTRFTRFVGGDELVGYGIAQGIEEPAAAVRVAPAFRMQAFRVRAHVEVFRPFLIGERARIAGSANVCLAGVAKLDFRAL